MKRMEEEKEYGNYDNHKPISMIKIVYRLVVEQKRLAFPYILTVVASIVGGGAYPAQAILFSHVLDVFKLEGEARTKRGDFFSLMFLVVAL